MHLVLALFLACGAPSTDPDPVPDATPATVGIPEEGKEYDPPVDPEEIPKGAWMCDMGTVHYAAPHEGDCPVCGMKLTQKK